MKHNTIYISLGSNINPVQNLKDAVKMLTRLTEVVAVSSVWETKPVGLVEQANFLNAAALIKTQLTASQFKQTVIHAIEQDLQRIRQADKNAPRTIDIDLVLFNRQIFKMGHNRIPDPDIVERSFLAIPLAEIDPDYEHPETGQTLSAIAARFSKDRTEMVLRRDVSSVLKQLVTAHAL